MKKKDVSTINDSVYNESYEHVDTISDSIKQVDTINDPMKETCIVDGVRTLSIGFGLLKPDVIIIIVQDSTDFVTHVLKNSIEQLSMKSSSLINTNQSNAIMIGSQCESVGGNRNIICTLLDK